MDLQAGKYRAVDDFYDGTVAAACGGTTTIVDHMAFGPKGCSLWHQVEEYHRIADVDTDRLISMSSSSVVSRPERNRRDRKSRRVQHFTL